MNIGMSEEEIEKIYAPRKQEQENNVFNSSILMQKSVQD
jgi:hypothetical protein